MDNFDEMTVNEAIKFWDEFRSVSAIKKGTFVNVTEEELEDIKTDLCDNYCSKRKEWTGDQDDFIEEICVNCPLTRL